MRAFLKKMRGRWERARLRTPAENVRALAEYLEIRPHLQGVPYLLAGVFVGMVAVLYSTSFSGAIKAAQWAAKHYPFVFVAASPIFFVLSVWAVRRFAPEAGGAGVPHVVAALGETDTARIGERINVRILLVTVVSSLVALLGGSGLGREGPMVLIAACVFYAIGNQFRRVFPESDHRSWIVAGGAAGIAAAFQTPLAGVVFVLEELAHVHYQSFKTYVITAVVVAGMIAQWLYGRYLFLGYAKVGAVPATTVVWAFLVGLICGVIAAYFERSRDFLLRRLSEARSVTPLRVAGVLGLLVGVIAVLEPQAVGGGIGTIEQLLFTEGNRAAWWLPAARFASTLLSHVAGAAGGFLAPSLALGASIGSLFSTSFTPVHHNLLVMAGMIAFLSATSRAPFTALVVVMEMTDSHSAIFPLMIAGVAGYGAVSLLRRRADLAAISPASET